MKFIIYILSFFLLIQNLWSQDIHFSQFDLNQSVLNPACTGNMLQDYRITTQYRSQWGSVSNPYTTMATNFDMNLFENKEKGLSDLGVGLGFYSDKAGSSNLSHNQVNFSLSAIQKTSKNSKIALGMQTSYNQNSIRVDNLTWDNQFVGHQFQANAASGESFASMQKSYFDISAGVLLVSEKVQGNIFNLGAGFFHANRANYSLFNNADKLAPKIVAHSTYEFYVGDMFDSRKMFLKGYYAQQGGHREFVIGGAYRNLFKQASRYTSFSNEAFLDFGIYYRAGDAIILNAVVDLFSIMVSVSYDVNASKFTQATSSKGGFEVALVFKSMFKDSRMKLIRGTR